MYCETAVKYSKILVCSKFCGPRSIMNSPPTCIKKRADSLVILTHVFPWRQNIQSGSMGGFTLDWDTPHSQDVVLWKKCESGEEVAVSALLGPESSEENGYPRNVAMKVCIKKPCLRSILQFDCGVWSRNYSSSYFTIHGVHFLPLSAPLGPSDYRGPLFSSLDPDLQDALEKYLRARGIGENLTNFLLLHLHKKEQNQYVSWLQKIENTVSEAE